MLVSSGEAYELEREQARRMGWLQDQEPEQTGVPIESLDDASDIANNIPRATRNEAIVMDSLLTELLKNKPTAPPIFVGDVVARLVRAGQPKVGQSWTFALSEDVQIDQTDLKAGDVLYAIVDDVDARGNLFLRATKAISVQSSTTVPLTLIAMNTATGLAGVPRPKVLKPGWVVQWKL